MTFPAKSAVSSYLSTERMLVDVLNVIPYCAAHTGVWSPSLVTVLLEAGSQLDSIWRAECRLSRFTAPKPNMVDYFKYFAPSVGDRWLVFWGDEPVKLYPYQNWSCLKAYDQQSYRRLDWWDAFTHLKHDRFEYRVQATLENSVAAVGALFLAILRCEPCRDEIAQTKWLNGANSSPAAWLGEDSTATWNQWITAESSLYTYPVGWCKRKIELGSCWDGAPASHRFYRWHQLHSQEAVG